MSESKIYTIPDGNNSLDPNLMLALSQNGGFGNGNWMWMMFMWILFPWIFNGNGFGGGFGNNGAGFLANQLNNDAGYLTEHQSLAEYAKTSDVNAALNIYKKYTLKSNSTNNKIDYLMSRGLTIHNRVLVTLQIIKAPYIHDIRCI